MIWLIAGWFDRDSQCDRRLIYGAECGLSSESGCDLRGAQRLEVSKHLVSDSAEVVAWKAEQQKDCQQLVANP